MRNSDAALRLPVLLLTLGCFCPAVSAQTISIGGLKIRLGPDRKNNPPPAAPGVSPYPYGGNGVVDMYGQRLASDADKRASADDDAEGSRLLKAGQDADAAQKFQEAVGLDPQNASAYNHLAIVSMNTRQYGVAMMCLRNAVRYDPNLESAYYNAGVICGQKTSGTYYNPSAAIGDFTKAIHLDPKNELAWAWRGWEYGDTGSNQKAIFDCKQALALDPKDAQVYCTLGEQQLKMGQDDKTAYANLRQSRTLNPSNGPMVANVIRLAMAGRAARAAAQKAYQRRLLAARQAQSKFQAQHREIVSVVHAGPQYYESVYREARREGESPEEASRREQEARNKYDRDVALQNAWEAGDTNTLDRIESGEMGQDEIAGYDSSNVPQAEGGGSAENGGENNGGQEQTPAEQPPAEEPPPMEEPPAGGE